MSSCCWTGINGRNSFWIAATLYEPGTIVLDPAAKFAYVAGFVDGAVAGFSIGSDGQLTPLPGSPFKVLGEPTAMAIDLTGQFLYLVHSFGSVVSAYKIGSAGALTPVPNSPFNEGHRPVSIAITPVF